MNNFDRSVMYYKIIGKNFGKYPYKLGLNTLADNREKFSRGAVCARGGLYFSDIKNIFGYLHYGDKVCTLTIPDDAQVIKVENKYKADKIYIHKITEINIDTIKYLVKCGADVDRLKHWAATTGNLEIIKYLAECGFKIITIDNEAILYASENGHLEIVKYLVECGADIKSHHNYAVNMAAYNGHLEIVKYLIECGVDVTADNNSLIRWAARKGHLELVKCLIERGADVNVIIDSTALYWAAYKGQLEILRYLVEHGADVTTDDYYVIRCAARRDQLEVVKYLLEHGAIAKKGFIINWAKQNGHTEIIEHIKMLTV